MDIILASKSPRRKDLLKMTGLSFTTVESDAEENAPRSLPPDEYVKVLSYQKAKAVQNRFPESCIIGADTIVYLNNEIIGKPKNTEDAKNTLSKMQGNQHVVYTGITVLTKDKEITAFDTTNVTFSHMSKEEIDWYVSTGEPMDKAGSYGVQGPGGIFVQKIEGNYFNVVGLPLPLLYNMLVDAGVLINGLNIKTDE